SPCYWHLWKMLLIHPFALCAAAVELMPFTPNLLARKLLSGIMIKPCIRWTLWKKSDPLVSKFLVRVKKRWMARLNLPKKPELILLILILAVRFLKLRKKEREPVV